MRETILLTPKQSRRVNSLIKKMCCNYDDGHCILLDDGDPCVCPQLITFSHIICKYFRFAVLPGDKDLYIEVTKPKNSKKCSLCGKEYLSKGNKSKYCDDCRKTITKKQAAERKRKQRLMSRNRDKKNLKIRLCNTQKRNGNIFYSKTSKMRSYCVTKNHIKTVIHNQRNIRRLLLKQ